MLLTEFLIREYKYLDFDKIHNFRVPIEGDWPKYTNNIAEDNNLDYKTTNLNFCYLYNTKSHEILTTEQASPFFQKINQIRKSLNNLVSFGEINHQYQIISLKFTQNYQGEPYLNISVRYMYLRSEENGIFCHTARDTHLWWLESNNILSSTTKRFLPLNATTAIDFTEGKDTILYNYPALKNVKSIYQEFNMQKHNYTSENLYPCPLTCNDVLHADNRQSMLETKYKKIGRLKSLLNFEDFATYELIGINQLYNKLTLAELKRFIAWLNKHHNQYQPEETGIYINKVNTISTALYCTYLLNTVDLSDISKATNPDKKIILDLVKIVFQHRLKIELDQKTIGQLDKLECQLRNKYESKTRVKKWVRAAKDPKWDQLKTNLQNSNIMLKMLTKPEELLVKPHLEQEVNIPRLNECTIVNLADDPKQSNNHAILGYLNPKTNKVRYFQVKAVNKRKPSKHIEYQVEDYGGWLSVGDSKLKKEVNKIMNGETPTNYGIFNDFSYK